MNPFRYDKTRRTLIPARPGYYWAKWLKAADGTHEADEVSWPALRWEIVQVNDNNVDDPADDEYLSVSVPGVRETQWRENFKWGPFVTPIVAAGLLYPAASLTAALPHLQAQEWTTIPLDQTEARAAGYEIDDACDTQRAPALVAEQRKVKS